MYQSYVNFFQIFHNHVTKKENLTEVDSIDDIIAFLETSRKIILTKLINF